MAGVPFDRMTGKIWFNGAFVDWAEAQIHVLTHGLHYASCVFEGERAYGGEIFKLALPFADTAVVTVPAGAPAPTGTVNFFVYGPNDATCAGAPVFNSLNRPLSAGGTATSGAFTPVAAGTLSPEAREQAIAPVPLVVVHRVRHLLRPGVLRPGCRS